MCITVKGSRVCEHCNVLAVRKYVRASMKAMNFQRCSPFCRIVTFVTFQPKKCDASVQPKYTIYFLTQS